MGTVIGGGYKRSAPVKNETSLVLTKTQLIEEQPALICILYTTKNSSVFRRLQAAVSNWL